MKTIIKLIPNTLTCLNLFSGCVAIVMALGGNFNNALYFIILSAAFDFLDGFAARLLNASSPIGKDLDSLADDISFGVAPATIVFALLRDMSYPAMFEGARSWFPYLAYIIAVFSALRLAKFNIDTRQQYSFIGLPVPANALFWASGVAGMQDYLLQGHVHPLIILLIVCFFSWLLVSEISMFSLKFKNWDWNNNKTSYLFVAVCVPILLIGKVGGFAFAILLYILWSIATNKKVKS